MLDIEWDFFSYYPCFFKEIQVFPVVESFKP